MAERLKLAICWLGACGGCDEAILDLNLTLLKIPDHFEIVFWPAAMDFKYDQVRTLPAKSIALSIISGAVRNSEHLELAELFREKSELVLAFGACACMGGTPGLANFSDKEEILKWIYQEAPTVVNPDGRLPRSETEVNGHSLTLPTFYNHVYTLDQSIDVDFYLPGCPPPPDLVANAIQAFINRDLPPKGSYLAPRKALCDTCPRNVKKPLRMEITQLKRIHEVEAEPEACFLDQGIICLGPATRGGCGAACIQTNTPCRGCFGHVPGVIDPGAKFLSALANLIKAEPNADIKEIMEPLVDPAGYFYRFSQAYSILGKKSLKTRREG